MVLYDRPNDNDQVLSAVLTFDDGSSVAVGQLPNNGSGLSVSFAAVNTTSLVFEVSGVSTTTSNVGLSEIQVYYTGYASSSSACDTLAEVVVQV